MPLRSVRLKLGSSLNFLVTKRGKKYARLTNHLAKTWVMTWNGASKHYATITLKDGTKIIKRHRQGGRWSVELHDSTERRPNPVGYNRNNSDDHSGDLTEDPGDHDEVNDNGRSLIEIGEVVPPVGPHRRHIHLQGESAQSPFRVSLEKAALQMMNDRNSGNEAGSKVGEESVLTPAYRPTYHKGIIALSDESFSTLSSLLSKLKMTFEEVVTIMYNIKAGRFHDKNGADPSQRSRSSIYDFELENSNNGWGMKTINEDWWNVPGDGIGDD